MTRSCVSQVSYCIGMSFVADVAARGRFGDRVVSSSVLLDDGVELSKLET